MIIGGWRGPGWRVVDADPGHGKQLRDWIRSVVTRHDCPVDPSDAELAISELYANAVLHGPAGGRVLAGYCLWSAGARIVVCDGGGSTTPQLNPSADLAEGGRGLRIIASVAAQWDCFRLPGAQVVWCDFGQPLCAPASDTWAWLHHILTACTLSEAAPQQDQAYAQAQSAGWPPAPVLAVPGVGARASLATRPARAATR